MSIKVVLLDFDGTLTEGDYSWTAVHRAFGSLASSSRAARLYRDGKISYREFMEIDTSLWPRPLHISLLDEILRDGIRLRPEAKEVVDALKGCGLITVMLSSALDIVACRAAEILGVELCLANGLGFDEKGFYDGRVHPMVEPLRKEEAAERILGDLGVSLKESAAVADSECDSSLLRAVGRGILVGDCSLAERIGATCAKSLSLVPEIICSRASKEKG